MQTAQLTQSLKQEANRLGFQLTGACPAVTPTGYPRFLDWLDAGYAGEMVYLEQRKDAYKHPRGVMPDTVSVLMLGMNYHFKGRESELPGTGKIASYAWGQGDYHDRIHKQLKQLKKYAIELAPNLSFRGVVDTAPLLEREFAQLAGLGWVGKNTLLLNKHRGSYFFLAALLVSGPLEFDAPTETSHCGTCTACLDACPTNAFVKPFVLDATKCISYLTIEHRSPIDPALRESMDGWVLGCDVCQDVCPWNRKAPQVDDEFFWPDGAQNPLSLRGLFELDDDSFRVMFRKSPLWRPKRRGILRNAAIAMGSQPDDENLAALSCGLNDEDPLIRGACAWALGKHGSSCLPLLQTRSTIEQDAQVLVEINNALSEVL